MSRWAGVSRSDWVWLALPYAFAVLGAVITAVSGQVGGGEAAWAAGLTLALLAWHTWWALWHPEWLERVLAPMLVYYAGLVLGCAVLLSISLTFLPLYLVCLPMAFVAVPGRWAYGCVAVSLLVGLVAPTLPEVQITVDNIVATLAGGLLAAIAGGAIRHAETQARARQEALTALGTAMAENAALAERLVEDERAAAAQRERDRISAQIHDTLAADLAGVVAQLEALGAEQPSSPRLERAAASARDALGAARESVTALRQQPSDVPLADRLRELGRDGDDTEPRVDVDTEAAEVDVDPLVADALVRGAQEAVRNAVRHAGARHVHVTLTDLTDTVAVDVVDDGDGFDADAPRDGHGLTITRERLAEVGGGLVVASEPGDGTAVTLTAPRRTT